MVVVVDRGGFGVEGFGRASPDAVTSTHRFGVGVEKIFFVFFFIHRVHSPDFVGDEMSGRAGVAMFPWLV